MKRRVLLILLSVLMISGLLPVNVLAAGTPPQTISAPKNLGVYDYNGSSVTCTISAPDDLRELLALTKEERGYHMTLRGQIDFKIDNGNWHYTSAWDDPSTYTKYSLNYYNAITGGEWKKYLGHDGFQFPVMFPDEKNVPPSGSKSWEWYKSHSITFRARFAIDFGNKNIVFSDWSPEYILSDKVKMDHKKIMNTYAPTLVSSRLAQDSKDKKPYIWLDLTQHADEMQKFNAAANNNMKVEIWMRKEGDKDFKLIGDSPFSNETLKLDVSSYYQGSNITDYAAAAYEVKVRYKVDERSYRQSGVTSQNWLYSPYSNTLSYGMPAWSAASAWATGELRKADEYGLIPDILNGADLTKNITREEFAEVALLMYQKASGITDTPPYSPNPFIDTTNPKVLQAFKLGIVKGMSATEFQPEKFINREQVSAMLTHAIKLIAPDADYSTTGAPVFTDQKDISGWALNDCLYISKIGIIKGTNGMFMPRAITDAQKAIGYANTSREQALAMSVRIVEKMQE